MKNDIVINIDTVKKDEKKKQLIVNGWRVNRKALSVPTIGVKGNFNVADYQIEDCVRKEVNAIYHLEEDSQCGFKAIIHYGDAFGYVRLLIESEGDERRVSFNLAKNNYDVNLKINRYLVEGKKGLKYFKENGLMATIKKIKRHRQKSIQRYQNWIQKMEEIPSDTVQRETMEGWAYKPRISIIMPVYNVEDQWLSKCIESVLHQSYPHWELCMADDCSTDLNVRPLLEKYAALDERIKVVFREKNGHICEASNSAIAMATGEFIALLDNDDTLAPHALYEVVAKLNDNPALDLIYSDEDKIDVSDRRNDPTFKPDWSPDLLMGTNYISHLGVYRRSLLTEIGGFRKGYEGAQDYDLVLRFTEKTKNIAHIPKILYHWRMLETSTAMNQDSKNYAFEAGILALTDALKRRGIQGKVEHSAVKGSYTIDYAVDTQALVSIIIPTRNGHDVLKKCVDSILLKTTYPHYEIIIADNGSDDEKSLRLVADYVKNHENIRVKTVDIPFNFAQINNEAAVEAKGEYLLFLNNDTEVITPKWIEGMVAYARWDRVGAVGAKLLYPDNTIQHAGVILGLGGAAGHGHIGYPRADVGYFGRLSVDVNYSAVTAACMMVKKKDFDQMGGFDPAFTVAFNDVDFCLRLRKEGKDNVWVHDVLLYHFESKSRGYEDSEEKQRRFKGETEMMNEKWGEWIENDPLYNPNLTRIRGDFSLKIN